MRRRKVKKHHVHRQKSCADPSARARKACARAWRLAMQAWKQRPPGKGREQRSLKSQTALHTRRFRTFPRNLANGLTRSYLLAPGPPVQPHFLYSPFSRRFPVPSLLLHAIHLPRAKPPLPHPSRPRTVKRAGKPATDATIAQLPQQFRPNSALRSGFPAPNANLLRQHNL